MSAGTDITTAEPMGYVKPHVRRNGQFVQGHFRASRGVHYSGGGGGGGDAGGAVVGAALVVGLIGGVIWFLFVSGIIYWLLGAGVLALTVWGARRASVHHQANLDRQFVEQLGDLRLQPTITTIEAEALLLLRRKSKPHPVEVQAVLEECRHTHRSGIDADPTQIALFEFALTDDTPQAQVEER